MTTPATTRTTPPPDAPAPGATGGVTDAPAPSRAASPATRRARRDGRARLLVSLASLVGGIGVWWVLCLLGFQLPTPAAVLSRGVELALSGALWTDTWASLRRVLAGFLLGVVAAVPVGFLMGWYAPVRAVLDPWIQFFRMIPPLAIIPLAIVLLGIDEGPRIFVIFLASFLANVVSTYQGVVSVDRTLINAARVLGAKDGTIFLRVVVPASTPFILVGMRIGLGAAWATVVAAELIAAQDGLGRSMQKAQLYYQIDTIFVGLVMIGLLGLAMDRLLLLAEKKLTGWQERR
ncbi:ABC transporter permease [Cellulosimicrobium composti]|uniref:ABC transporter permease n=1 Tax=Cellulosimicrobium composti TaxID=2672572 RepID=UPI0004677077|nr:NitT/TauT family transport system permease protein [Cellulosimicrobium cellulans J34]SMF22183.1 NitT/TauT family transport system permease protein [Cellulosimicrobium cellulans J1]